MLKVIVIGYDKMLSSLVAGSIAAGHKVVGVLRNDRVKYHPCLLFIKDIFAPSVDLSFMKSYNLYDIKAKSVNSPEFEREFKKLDADIILVGSWSEKFSCNVLNLPRLGAVNAHPSLLPENRGPNPYFWAIYQGKMHTGLTFHCMDENLDTGKILAQAGIEIDPEMTAGELKNKICQIAKLMIGELLNELEAGVVIPIKQNELEASYENQYTIDEILIDFNRPIKDVKNNIRALLPAQTPYCNINDVVRKIKNYAIFCGEKKFKKSHIFRCLDGEIEIELF